MPTCGGKALPHFPAFDVRAMFARSWRAAVHRAGVQPPRCVAAFGRLPRHGRLGALSGDGPHDRALSSYSLAAPTFLVRRERWPFKEPYRSMVLPFGEPSRRWIQSFCVAAMHGRRIWRYLREQESASIAVSQSSRESMAGQPELSQEFANIAVSQWMDVHKKRAFHRNLD